ncbi:hypothetical protein [Actinotalea sp. Marseille-Q4924]|uniref:hypothetical protein n=1 Tax=Actinotalea sp. Marseille-Q4924 TaxID=2866571 RepID=UPI001CE3EA6E|nr:hypothetical protein [Actinotalea sp. Marseille-Q4924]
MTTKEPRRPLRKGRGFVLGMLVAVGGGLLVGWLTGELLFGAGVGLGVGLALGAFLEDLFAER